MKHKTVKQANKAKKNKLITKGYAGTACAREALKAGEHKLFKGVRVCG